MKRPKTVERKFCIICHFPFLRYLYYFTADQKFLKFQVFANLQFMLRF